MLNVKQMNNSCMQHIDYSQQQTLADFDYRLLIKALGKGIKGARSLSIEEAKLLIMGFAAGHVTRAQMASAMMLMRVRGETESEIAGVALGLKQLLQPQWQQLDVDIDWPVYAGKREQLPWLLLSAKLLAKQGKRIVLHGDAQSLSHRRHVGHCVQALGIETCQMPAQVNKALAKHNIVYVDATAMLPVINECRSLHQELGLRSLIQFSVRCINPCNATLSLRSYFHPGLDKTHANVAKLMGNYLLNNPAQQGKNDEPDNYSLIAIFKGLQGETEFNPRVSTDLRLVALSNEKEVASFNEYAFSIPTVLEAVSAVKIGQAELSEANLSTLWETGRLGLPSTERTSLMMQIAQASTCLTFAMADKLLSFNVTTPTSSSTKGDKKAAQLANYTEVEFSEAQIIALYEQAKTILHSRWSDTTMDTTKTCLAVDEYSLEVPCKTGSTHQTVCSQ
ncbi:glycosyl transferase [Shewanella maritima]|uniref:glycosyl transferase n=1 Tax=Shewanella maritima TaxID=2520507 RepID=UPI003735543E